jgi:hypothetical protein
LQSGSTSCRGDLRIGKFFRQIRKLRSADKIGRVIY